MLQQVHHTLVCLSPSLFPIASRTPLCLAASNFLKTKLVFMQLLSMHTKPKEVFSPTSFSKKGQL